MAKLLRSYELRPVDGRKSFYARAVVRVYDDGTEVMRSYETDVMAKRPDGTLVRLVKYWNGKDGAVSEWSNTTGRHIKAFCGINKATYIKMPVEKIGDDYLD